MSGRRSPFLNVPGPPCKTCQHPQREAIDRAIVSRSASIRHIAAQYGISPQAIIRHEDEHLPQALIVYEREKRNGALAIAGEIFHTNVKRRSLAQDACHRWLTDPENPAQYDLGARSEEVTVTYEDLDVDEAGRPVKARRKARLHVLLKGLREEHGIRVTGFETKFADPRRLLTDYSNALRGELTLFMAAWTEWQEQEAERREAEAAKAAEADALQALFAATLGEVLASDLRDALVEAGVAAEVAGVAAEQTAIPLLRRIVARFSERG